MTEEKRTEEKEAEDVKSADKKKKNRILNIVILCAVCIIAYGVFNMISLQKQYKRAGEENAQVQKTEVWIRLRMFRLIRRRMTGTRGFCMCRWI